MWKSIRHFAVVDGLVVKTHVLPHGDYLGAAGGMFSQNAQHYVLWLVIVSREQGSMPHTAIVIDGVSHDYRGAALRAAPRFSLDGQRVGYVLDMQPSGCSQAVVDGQPDASGEPWVIAEDSFVFSPDSAHYAYVAREQRYALRPGEENNATRKQQDDLVGWFVVVDGKRSPETVEIWLDYGKACLYEGNGLGAELAFRAALRLDEGAVQTYEHLAMVLMRRDRIVEARCLYEKAVTLPGAESRLWSGYGFCLLDLGNEADALKAFRQSVRLNTDQAAVVSARLGASVVLRRSGDLGGAQSEYEEAVKVNPGLAASLLQEGNESPTTRPKEGLGVRP